MASKSVSRDYDQCFNCHEFGHMAQQCPNACSNGRQTGNAQQHIYVTPTTPVQQPVYVTSPQQLYTPSPQPNP